MQDLEQQQPEEEERVIGVERFDTSAPVGGQQAEPEQQQRTEAYQAPQQEQPRAVAGEITERSPQPERAATGEIVPSSARSAGAFVDLLEDGQFSMDSHEEIRELMSAMTDISNATGQKVKGKVTITIDLTKDGEAFTVQGKVVTKAPDMPRPKSIIWADDTGNPCRFPPNQVQMFGGARAPLRRI